MIKDLYDISIYIRNSCVQSKIMIRTKWTYPLPNSTVSLIAEKLPSLLKLWNFQMVSFFCEQLRVIPWVDYFVLQICWRCVEKSVLIKMTLKLAKSQKAEKKYN